MVSLRFTVIRPVVNRASRCNAPASEPSRGNKAKIAISMYPQRLLVRSERPLKVKNANWITAKSKDLPGEKPDRADHDWTEKDLLLRAE
jgi:hypothetical protein